MLVSSDYYCLYELSLNIQACSKKVRDFMMTKLKAKLSPFLTSSTNKRSELPSVPLHSGDEALSRVRLPSSG